MNLNGIIQEILEDEQPPPASKIPAVGFLLKSGEIADQHWGKEFKSWYELGAYIRQFIAPHAPKGGGYDKVDVVITFADESEYSGRLDVQHTTDPDNDSDVAKHVYDFVSFHAGIWTESAFINHHLTYEKYQKYIQRQPRGTEEYLQWLNEYLIPTSDYTREAGCGVEEPLPVVISCERCGREYTPIKWGFLCGGCKRQEAEAQARKRLLEEAQRIKREDPLFPVLEEGRTAVGRKIRQLLKERSGKTWSCKGGRGTGWGWLTISAPPARQSEYGTMSAEDQRELSDLLGTSSLVANQGESVRSGDWWHYLKAARGDFEPQWEKNYSVLAPHATHILNSLRAGPLTPEELINDYGQHTSPSLEHWNIHTILYILEKQGEVEQVENNSWRIKNG